MCVSVVLYCSRLSCMYRYQMCMRYFPDGLYAAPCATMRVMLLLWRFPCQTKPLKCARKNFISCLIGTAGNLSKGPAGLVQWLVWSLISLDRNLVDEKMKARARTLCKRPSLTPESCLGGQQRENCIELSNLGGRQGAFYGCRLCHKVTLLWP